MINYRHDFAKHILANGFSCPDLPIDDGVYHRFHIAGDKPGSKSGWYVLNGGAAPTGAYGSWRSDIKITWRAHTNRRVSREAQEADKRLRNLAQQKRTKETQRQNLAAANIASQRLASAFPADPNHPYLKTKQVSPYKLRQVGDVLLVPLYANCQLVNLQKIYANGEKRFLFGGKVKGAYYPIRGPQEKLIICEGVATAHTLHSLTGSSTVAAMNCNNLLHVALYFRQRYPDLEIVVAADNDHRTDGNPGKSKGIAAAQAVNGLIAWPPFPQGASGSDFNDLVNLEPER